MRGRALRRSDSEEDENLLGSNPGKQKDIPETEYRQLGLQDNTGAVGLATSSLRPFTTSASTQRTWQGFEGGYRY